MKIKYKIIAGSHACAGRSNGRTIKVMTWHVYFLKSLLKKNWTYVGSTNNLMRRINEHNSKKVLATKAYAPYSLIYTEHFDSEDKARQREQYFKYWKGRIDKKNIIKNLK